MNDNENKMELSPEEQAAAEKRVQMDDCAQMIRNAGKQEDFLAAATLCQHLSLEREALLALLANMKSDEEYQDICCYTGEKDLYYYTYPTLAHNYVKNSVMALEDDLMHTISEVVRYESKTYPRATSIDSFGKTPYDYTVIQVKRMLEKMEKMEEFADIKTYVSNQKNIYLFSTKHLTPRYAATLVEMSEDKRLWM